MAAESALGLLLLFPLLGSVVSYLGGLVRPAGAGWIATGAAVGAFVCTCLLVSGLSPEGSVELHLFEWIQVHDLTLSFAFRFDALAAVMCLVVTGVGSLIHLYSIGYMAEDASRPRFFAYLNLFLFSMLILVLGANLPVLFIGWEGVGLCSYLLIGFWHKNVSFAAAGRKAFIVNRIGDAGFLIGMFVLFNHFRSLDIAELSNLVTGADVGATALIATLALFVGATGKSAQIPLFVWLPDAMAGPTPVSALIHAATMVTAGIYLMARLSFLFAAAPLTGAVVVFVAVATALVAASIALVQHDIKKVLAYSTVSQLGFMFIAAGVGAYWVAVFHLVTHAFFKACLFLCAGSVIAGCHHEQDMRKMGGLRRLMPVTFWTYVVSTLAIAGIYPFAGYFSKHAITAALAKAHNPYLEPFTGWLGFIVTATAGLTAFYMTRSLVMTFFGQYRGEAHPHESPAVMTGPLVVLALLALTGGLALVGPLDLSAYLGAVVPVQYGAHGEGLLSGLLHSWVGVLGIAAAYVMYVHRPQYPARIAKTASPLTRLLEGKYYFDELYHAVIVWPLYSLAGFLWRWVDQVLIDGAVNGAAAVIEVNGELFRSWQTGHVRHYVALMVSGVLVVIGLYMVL